MTDNEILDQWHRLRQAHDQVGDHDILEAYVDMVQAEDKAISRFGLGGHNEAYRARFPALTTSTS